jgi:hypothetical protein
LDPAIYRENQSIEIVNATRIDGLGAKFASFISNIGGNPVMVSSSNDVIGKSKIIYYGKESYTVKKLSTYFNIKKENSKTRRLADVIIIVGKDLVQE